MRPDLKRLVDELREIEQDLRDAGLEEAARFVWLARENVQSGESDGG